MSTAVENVVDESNAEDFYFKYAAAQDALSLKEALEIDPALSASWLDVLSRRWPELAPMASCSRVEELSARLAFSGVSPVAAATLNPPDLAASCGVCMTDAVVIINALRLESVGDSAKRRMMQQAGRATAQHHPQISDLNFVDPHAPNQNITISAVTSIGPRAAIQDSDTVHSLIAFVVTLFIWSEFPFMNDEVGGIAAQVLEMVVVALWILSLFCAITMSIATLAAKDSDYMACNFLAIPYTARYLDGWLFLSSLLLTVVRAALVLHDTSNTWNFAVFVSVNLATLSFAAAYAFVMFMRVNTSTRVPARQWFRWFPRGTAYTRRKVSELLMHTGNFAKREFQKELRVAVCSAMAEQAFREPKSDVRLSSRTVAEATEEPLPSLTLNGAPPIRRRSLVQSATTAGAELLSPTQTLMIPSVSFTGVPAATPPFMGALVGPRSPSFGGVPVVSPPCMGALAGPRSPSSTVAFLGPQIPATRSSGMRAQEES